MSSKKLQQKKQSTSKSKGNSFEREVAKTLSIWIYKDPNALRRHPTSGAEKNFGNGADIANFNPDFPNLNVFIEVKRGYKDDIFNARKQILEWYNVAKPKNTQNYPIWIIWKILNRGIIIASTQQFQSITPLFLIDDLFIYDFKELIKIPYENI